MFSFFTELQATDLIAFACTDLKSTILFPGVKLCFMFFGDHEIYRRYTVYTFIFSARKSGFLTTNKAVSHKNSKYLF